jgi:RNA polymerase sigma factor (TIGR02999 family)
MNEVTRILNALEKGRPHAAAELLPLVYDELRRLAAQSLAQERPGQTLQPTALVHEAYLRLVGPADDSRWENRGHFFAAAAEAMRRILVENARRKRRLRHGGAAQRVELAADLLASEQGSLDDVLAVDEALDHLAASDSSTAQLVKLVFFAGLTMEQAAQALSIAPRTAYRNWAYARAWLFRRLQGTKPPASAP